MKYSELHRILKAQGCYLTGMQRHGHPEWYSPITGIKFITSNHTSQEVKAGTLKAIAKQSGIKL